MSSIPPASHPSRRPNQLSQEKSPYLLQHQFNPVDWLPWSSEAFRLARESGKPLFLSIGYSTCHWCHVMERETFENKSIASFLNAHFISIKVDREERPDVDKIYMTYVQSTQGGGGWPLNVFLTPDLKPFYGGTYFPPEAKLGRPGFRQLLEHIHEIWTERKADVFASASQTHAQLQKFTAREPEAGRVLTLRELDHAFAKFKDEYDEKHGGFGNAPKFPRPSQPAFMLRQAVRRQDDRALRMVLHTCERMAAGGLHDQLGGGFARYSVDRKWLVPHFEKMLYDNAQLAGLYLDAYRVSGHPGHAQTVRRLLEYIRRDMTHPEGGFYSAEDADSEGKEGKFYCWTLDEIRTLLAPEEAALAIRYYGITAEGNFHDHSDPQALAGQNVLHVADARLSPGEEPLLQSVQAKLFSARAKRVRPHRDDKILSSWNGLMLGACARAYAILEEPAYLEMARRNLRFLQRRLWDPDTKTLYHRWREGHRDDVQLLDAYAFLASGVLDYYQATLEPSALSFCVELCESMLKGFFDAANGGFWQSAGQASDLILRLKEDYDGAEPSGNSVATGVLLRLATITERPDFREAAEKTLRLFADRLQELPQAVPHLLLALDFWIDVPRRVVVTGNPAEPGTAQLLRNILQVYQPGMVVLGTTGAVEPFAKTLPLAGAPLAYVCTGQTCQAPTRDPAALRSLLIDSPTGGANRLKPRD